MLDTLLLAVGAGPEQRCAIERARARGFRIVALDGDPSAPGFELAHQAIVLDIADREAVLAALKEYTPQAVLAAPIGRYLTTVGAINDHFKLRGISESAALLCTDKLLFHQRMLASRLARPCQYSADDPEGLLTAIESCGTPCVLKPRFGSGSRGVILIEQQSDISSAIDAFHRWVGTTVPSLVESVLEGQEIGIDAVMVGSTLEVLLLRAKTMSPLPYRQELAYLSPAPLPIEIQQNIFGAVAAACAAVELTDCAINADVMVDAAGTAHVIEITGRPAGMLVADLIIPAALGLNYYDCLIDLALAGEWRHRPSRGDAIAFGFLPLPSGRVAGLPTRLTESPHLKYRLPVLGARLGILRSGADALARGWAMATGEYPEQAQHRLDAGLDELMNGILIDE